ncbi:shikimate dehydrogenase family protein [Microbacterium sp. NPDC091313]
MLTGTRLAVWGDPIDHSLSPRVHGAAYGVLGLAWEYGRRQVDEAGFAGALGEREASWRGLSLTMPLKGVAARTARTRDRAAELTGAVNTLLFDEAVPAGFNTDVGGLVRAFREQGIDELATARILGAGATATSALVALVELGARRVEVRARRPDAVAPLAALGAALGAEVVAAPFGAAAQVRVDATVAALPGGTDLGPVAADLAATGGPLVDVVYGRWPTPLSIAWEAAGDGAVSGLGMLLHQALLQVRIFVTGDARTALDAEPLVLAAMRRALVGD